MSWFSYLSALLTTHLVMFALLSVCVTAVMVLAWKAQHSATNPFDLIDLVIEDGKLSPTKLAFALAFCMTSWVIVDQEVRGALAEGVFTAYLIAWVGPLVARVVFNKKEPGAAPRLPGRDGEAHD